MMTTTTCHSENKPLSPLSTPAPPQYTRSAAHALYLCARASAAYALRLSARQARRQPRATTPPSNFLLKPPSIFVLTLTGAESTTSPSPSSSGSSLSNWSRIESARASRNGAVARPRSWSRTAISLARNVISDGSLLAGSLVGAAEQAHSPPR